MTFVSNASVQAPLTQEGLLDLAAVKEESGNLLEVEQESRDDVAAVHQADCQQ